MANCELKVGPVNALCRGMTRSSTTRVRDVMTDHVYQVSPDTTADIAWEVMRMRRIHHLAVTQDRRVVGVLSARDFGGIKGRRARESRTVADLMTLTVVTASPATSLRRAANIMRGYGIGCLVVVEEGRLVGIVTAADLLDLVDQASHRRVSAPAQRMIHRRALPSTSHNAANNT
jgi:acetoin utilization protein AcuB